jgi:amino acid adenylation domain-containing protein
VTPTEHVLLFTMHHIVSDGWSMGVLVREFAQVYDALARDVVPSLAPLALQYADYAAWQRASSTGSQRFDREVQQWVDSLRGAPAAIDLPTDRPRPLVPARVGRALEFDVDAALTTALRTLGRSHGATLFMTLLGACSVLLARQAGQTDVVVGTSLANRTRPELEPLIGLFVNVLPLRMQLESSASFHDVVERAKQSCLDAFSRQTVPFDRIVEAVNPPRDLNRSPLYQVVFVMHAPEQEIELRDLKIEPLVMTDRNSQSELEIDAVERGDTLRFTITYPVELFDSSTIERLGDQLVTLLRAMVRAPEASAFEAVLVSENELARLRRWEGGPAERRSERLWHEQFEEQATRAPNDEAVRMGSRALSFAELDSFANDIAAELQSFGIGPGHFVAVCLSRSPEAVAALLGVLKTGAAYVPIDVEAPAQRIAKILRDVGAQAAVTEPSLARLVFSVRKRVDVTRRKKSEPRRRTDSHPDSAAYVLYTSGSTGEPKGVVVPHRAILALIASTAEIYGSAGRHSIAVNSPFHFDASVEQLVQLVRGHRIVLLEAQARLDPAQLLDTIERLKITSLDTTPTQLKPLVVLAERTGRTLPPQITVGGEALDGALWASLATFKDTRALNVYGPTEATVDATMAVVAPGAGPVIGHPLAGVTAYVLDRCGRRVPLGVFGELHLGGDQISHGYFARPGLTAARFVPDPFAERAGSRLYRTGDRVRWLEDGQLEFGGRLDEQVKVSGFRIELGEIEAALRSVAGVQSVVVVTRELRAGEQSLLAYAVAPDVTDAAVLRTRLGESLPAYMVPEHIVLLQALPMLPTGKIDRRALPEPVRETSDPHVLGGAGGPIGRGVTAAWSAALGIASPSLDKSFFEQGGTSFTLLRLHKELQALATQPIEVEQLFRHVTIAQQVAYIEKLAAVTIAPLAEGPPSVDAPASGAPESAVAATKDAAKSHGRGGLAAQRDRRRRGGGHEE